MGVAYFSGMGIVAGFESNVGLAVIIPGELV